MSVRIATGGAADQAVGRRIARLVDERIASAIPAQDPTMWGPAAEAGATSALGWSSDDISPGGQVAAIQALMTNAGRIKPVHHEFGGDPRYSDPAMAA